MLVETEIRGFAFFVARLVARVLHRVTAAVVLDLRVRGPVVPREQRREVVHQLVIREVGHGPHVRTVFGDFVVLLGYPLFFLEVEGLFVLGDFRVMLFQIFELFVFQRLWGRVVLSGEFGVVFVFALKRIRLRLAGYVDLDCGEGALSVFVNVGVVAWLDFPGRGVCDQIVDVRYLLHLRLLVLLHRLENAV